MGNYWRRGRLTRRRLLQGAGLGLAGFAGSILIGCSSSDDEQGPSSGGSSSGSASGAGTPNPQRTPGPVIDVDGAPVYSARFPEKTRTLSDYHWSKHPDRLNPQIPRRGGVVVSEFYGSPEHNFVTTGNQGSAAMAALCSNTMVAIDYGVFADNDNLQVTARNSLSESWEIPDTQTYVFHLREGVKWHNVAPVNGRDFTAEDAKFAWEVLRDDPSSAHGAIFSDVTAIEVVDDHTMKVTLSQPNVAFLKSVAAPYASIFSREQWEGPDSLSRTTIGTGPFIEEKFDPASGATYVRNPDYFMFDEFGERLPYIDALLDVEIADAESARAAFVSKQIDNIVHGRISRTEDLERMREQVPDHGLQVWPPNGTLLYILNFNQRNPLLDDVRVRRALSLSMDRVNTFIDTLNLGSATTAGYLVHTFLGQRFPLPLDQLGPWVEYNPGEARALLDAAGAPNPLTLEVLNSSPARATFVEGIQPDYREAGVELQLQTVEAVAAVNAYFNREWSDLHTWNQVTVSGNDMDGWAYGRYHSRSPQNSGGYSNPRVDELAEAQRREHNPDARRELWEEMHTILMDEVPLLIAGGTFEPVMWHSYLHEFTDNFVSWMLSWAGTQFQNVWVDDRVPQRSVKELRDDPKGFVRRHLRGVPLIT